MKKEREQQVVEILEDHLNEQSLLDYHNVDGLIECDQTITEDEWEHVRDHYNVVVYLEPKDAKPT